MGLFFFVRTNVKEQLMFDNSTSPYSAYWVKVEASVYVQQTVIYVRGAWHEVLLQYLLKVQQYYHSKYCHAYSDLKKKKSN